MNDWIHDSCENCGVRFEDGDTAEAGETISHIDAEREICDFEGYGICKACDQAIDELDEYHAQFLHFFVH